MRLDDGTQVNITNVADLIDQASKFEQQKNEMDQQLDLIMGAKKSLEATLVSERKHRQELEEKLQTLKAKPIKSTSETVSQEEK